jgi:hypothetical protein
MSARVAGLAILGAEVVALGVERPRVYGVWAIFVVVQFAALIWCTDPRSADALRLFVPAALAGVSAAAAWTALAFAAPAIATTDMSALLVIVMSGLAVFAWPPRRTVRAVRPLVLTAGAVSSVLIFLVISSVLPAFSGFVANNHPPTYTDVTRLVDPILEFAIFVLLALALGAEGLWRRAQTRRAVEIRTFHMTGPNEMVVLPDDAN